MEMSNKSVSSEQKDNAPGAPPTGLTLGIELSTQSAKIVLLDLHTQKVAFTEKIDYDSHFPQYLTRGGVLPNANPEIRHTSPLMLLDALDAIFGKLASCGLDPLLIHAVKVDAMQHCTVYSDATFPSRLRSLDPGRTLREQLADCLTRPSVPIWEDRSPKKEVEFLDRFLQEDGGTIVITGNQAELRFSAAQVMKWGRQSPTDYEKTSYIQLLSSFLTSLLCGVPAPVDTGDGWGTNWNHLDLARPGWHPQPLSAVDHYLNRDGSGSLSARIGAMTPYDQPLGTIHPYFAKKYGLPKTAVILAGSGDNPTTLLGCGGATTISLGSSYTVNGILDDIRPSPTGEYNLFGYTPGRAMALSVISNGGKVHHLFMRRYILADPVQEISSSHWEVYLRKAGTAYLHPDEKLMLPYLFAESVPLRPRGIIRFGFAEDDDSSNIRALHISQALSLKLHAGHLPNRGALCIAAGGAQNSILRQWISDVFQADTYAILHADYVAPLGCAVSGARHILNISYEEAVSRFITVEASSILTPLPENRRVIDVLLDRYQKLETESAP